MKYPSTLPTAHQQLLSDIIRIFSGDKRVNAIGASGSFASNQMDQYSDLDLVIAIEPAFIDEVMAERFKLVNAIPGYIEGFTGEHVGEPRLIIALYELPQSNPSLVHVDFKFVSLTDAAQRVDNTQVIWERSSLLSDIYASSEYGYPQPDCQWIEDRFWIWVHYGAGKIARGEYFEALEFLSFLRTVVLSPLALQQAGLTPSGVRTIEKRLPAFAAELKQTVATAERDTLIPAFTACIAMYIGLREKTTAKVNSRAQQLAISYFNVELKA